MDLRSSTSQGSTARSQDGLISVVVPAWNAATYLRPCLKGLNASTDCQFEVIVVDDASQDGTPLGGNGARGQPDSHG